MPDIEYTGSEDLMLGFDARYEHTSWNVALENCNRNPDIGTLATIDTQELQKQAQTLADNSGNCQDRNIWIGADYIENVGWRW